MHEIIHVVDPESPAGAAPQGLEIEAVDGRPLASGYYFVLWPRKTGLPDNRGKRYFGPFSTRTEARLLQRSALTLGLLVEDEKLTQSIVECRSIARPSAAAGKPRFAQDWSRWGGQDVLHHFRQGVQPPAAQLVT